MKKIFIPILLLSSCIRSIDTTSEEREHVKDLSVKILIAKQGVEKLVQKYQAEIDKSGESTVYKSLVSQRDEEVKKLQIKCESKREILSLDELKVDEYLKCVTKPSGGKK